MMGVTHMIVGAAVGYLATQTVTGAVVGGTAALLPDIDHPNSKLGRRVPILPTVINKLVGHRTLTHSILVLFTLTGILYVTTSLSVTVAFFVGYLSHLILDSLTVSGVPFLYPFSRRNYGLRFCYTQGIFEKVFLIVFILGFAGYLVHTNSYLYEVFTMVQEWFLLR